MVSPKALVLFICCNILAVNAYSSYYDRSDSYGVYRYNSYGEKRYSRCYDRYSRTTDLCRSSSYGRGRYDRDDRYDSYDRNDYYGRSDYDAGLRIGRGSFRILSNGRDAELSCEFPRGSQLISNVVWERVDRGRSYYNNYRSKRYNAVPSSDTRNSLSHLGHRSTVRSLGDYGSILTIRDYDSRDDAGTYRCTATRSYRGYSSYSGRRETVYMEVEFNPRYEDSYYGRNNYDDYFNRRHNSYDRPYSYAYAKTSEDTAVIDNAVDEKSTEDNESARQ